MIIRKRSRTNKILAIILTLMMMNLEIIIMRIMKKKFYSGVLNKRGRVRINGRVGNGKFFERVRINFQLSSFE